MQDTPGEDITSVLYDAFDFIREAHEAGGRVLVRPPFFFYKRI